MAEVEGADALTHRTRMHPGQGRYARQRVEAEHGASRPIPPADR